MKKGKNVAMYLVFALLLLLPLTIKNGYYMLLINKVLVYSVAVIGMNFINGMIGENNLGIAGTFAIGAYVSSILVTRFGVPTIIALACACLAGLIVGQLIGRPSLRVQGIYFALTTLMFGNIVRLLATNMEITNGTVGILNIPRYELFGLVLKTDTSIFFAYYCVFLCVLWISNRLSVSRWGREWKAIRDNEGAVATCGINLANKKIVAFSVSSVIGCLAGSMYAHMMGYIHPDIFSFDLTVEFLMALMLGGLGNVYGAILGAIIVVILPEALRFLGDYYWFTFSAILMVFVLIKPFGIMSIIGDVRKWFAQNKRRKAEVTVK